MSGLGSTEVTRSKDGVPQWDGDATKFQEYEEQALQWEQSIPYHKRYLAGPKLVAELSGPARKHVTGKRPEWLSYDGGVSHLLRHLRDCLGRPTIPEMTDYLNKYFRMSRMKRFETMNSYITRKVEVYHRARQSLSRVQKHYAHHQHDDQWWQTPAWRSWRSWDWQGRSWRSNQSQSQNGSEAPASPEADGAGGQPEEEEEQWYDAPSTPYEESASWHYSASRHATSEDEPWKLHTEELLPEFLQGWYLLADAGLDSTEKNMIQTALQDDYTVQRVSRELRLQWPDEDLKRRDQQSKFAGFWNEDYEFADDDVDEKEKAMIMSELNDEGMVLYGEAEKEVQEAYAMIQNGRRTLKEARARQHAVRLSRQYYRTSGGRNYSNGHGPPQTQAPRAAGDPVCLRCGKAHRTSECPDKTRPDTGHANVVEEAPFVCFTEESAMTAMAASSEARSTQEAVRAGCAVIDGGATRTLGSVEAIQAVMDLNASKHGDQRLKGVDVNNRPLFGFGNSSQDRCVSTANLGVTANQKPGLLQVHALDRGSGPILLSIQTLRSLKAVIDFEADLLVLRGLDDTKVIPLERSAAGHQLISLTDDLFQKAHTCKSRVPSLRDYL